MIINHNVAALNTYRQYNVANKAMNNSMEKLSSGLRINRAGDDAAGLAISEKMRGQIRGLDQASRNAQDAISLIQTAEGALNETHSILQRMRQLAVQAANDTNTAEDRKNIQDEIDQLYQEIDRIADTTQFNTKNLLDGSMDKTTSANPNKNANAALKTLDTDGNVVKIAYDETNPANSTKLINLTDVDGNKLGIAAGDKIKISYVVNGQVKEKDVTVSDTTSINDLKADDYAFALETDGSLTATAVAQGYTGAVHGITITVKDAKDNVRSVASSVLSSFAETQQASEKNSDGSLTFQIGANTGQTMNLSVKNMGAAALGVKNLKVGNQGQATVAIKVIDGAIAKVSSERSKLGATQNRLEHIINNLSTSSENLTAAESRIRDVDMAKEMMEQTKNNILSQAAQAMLAQANQAPQAVLQLLR